MSITRLFHVSDLHFGRADQAALDWFAAAVAAERPDAVVVTGDLTMRARSAEFAAAEAWLTGLGVPVTIEPGNHDLPYFDPFARFFRPYRRFGRIEGKVERPLDLPGIWLVPLRTTARAQWRLNWASGRVSRRSLDRALDLLAGKPADALAIVACHHPLVDRAGIQSRAKTHGGSEALAALAGAGADVVLSGHVHDPFDALLTETPRPIRMLGAGTLSERVRESRPSFNDLAVRDGGLTVAVRTMG